MTTATSDAGQEKKGDDRFKERVTVHRADAKTGKLLGEPTKDVKAEKIDKGDGKVWFRVPVGQVLGAAATKGTEITEADGTVWVAEEGAGGKTGPGIYKCVKKEPDKKPD